MSGENQSPRGGLRLIVRRQQVFEDVEPMVLSDQYAAADLVTSRAGLAWGAPLFVAGRDLITVLVDATVVASQTSLIVAVQDSWSDGTAGTLWYDRQATDTDQAIDVSSFAAGAHRRSLVFGVRASWVRFGVYGAGTVVGARAQLRGLRMQRYS